MSDLLLLFELSLLRSFLWIRMVLFDIFCF
jgi:hypothetical protein